MEIHLKPELEELIKQDVQRGSCQNVDESVESAVSMLHEQEVGSAENRLEIAAKIDEGHASAQHGELEAADFVRCRMSEMQPDRRTCRAKDEQLSVHASSPADLFGIWSFIAKDNPPAADRVEDAIVHACDFLADSPLAGRIRKDLMPHPVRFRVLPPFSTT